MLAVGSDDTNPSAGGKVQIHEYYDDSRYLHNKTIMTTYYMCFGFPVFYIKNYYGIPFKPIFGV